MFLRRSGLVKLTGDWAHLFPLRLRRLMCGGGSAPPELLTPIFLGLRPSLGGAAGFDQWLPEGHSPSAHRAAEPLLEFLPMRQPCELVMIRL